MSAATEQSIALVSEARQLLSQTKSVPDIRRVMELAAAGGDMARRAAKYLASQRASAEMVDAAERVANEAAAVKIEAQAKAGETLRRMKETGERGGGRPAKELPAETLSDLGVTKVQSHRWQQVAAVPPEVRQAYIDKTKDEGGEVTTAGLLNCVVEEADRTEALEMILTGGGKKLNVSFHGGYAETEEEFAKRSATVPGVQLRELVLLYTREDREKVAKLMDDLGKRWGMTRSAVVFRALLGAS